MAQSKIAELLERAHAPTAKVSERGTITLEIPARARERESVIKTPLSYQPQRDLRGRWLKGASGNLAGPGHSGWAPWLIAALTADCEECIALLVGVVRGEILEVSETNGQRTVRRPGVKDRVAAAKELMDRCWGKVPEKVQLATARSERDLRAEDLTHEEQEFILGLATRRFPSAPSVVDGEVAPADGSVTPERAGGGEAPPLEGGAGPQPR